MAGELLLEIGVEEVPSHYLPRTLEQMGSLAARLFDEHRLSYGKITTLATPRRLVLRVEKLLEKQSKGATEIQGPPKRAAFDAHGKPTQAAMGFAKAQGILPAALKIKKTDRGEYLVAVIEATRRATTDLLKELLPQYLAALVFPKTMRWGDDKTRFVRPIHWILAVYSGRLIPFRYARIASSNRSRGHALMSPGTFPVRDFKSYLRGTRKRYVIVDPAEREKIIRKQIAQLARSKKGKTQEDEVLLERNTFQSEYPKALCGSFEPEFLKLPSEVLVHVMREQQGYFAVYGPEQRLLPNFICVVDISTKNMKTILIGHERVLRARLEDARFYLQEDQRIPLDRRVESLSGVIFYEQLGSLYEKVERLSALGSYLAQHLDPASLRTVQRAAWLCKADLVTGMVREFPELQGVMGREYARSQGEPEETARAIFEHYLPRSPSDTWMPKVATSKFLAIADKLDTVCGCFGIGLLPKGSEDPYGLRRHGSGLVRILVDGIFLKLSLQDLIRIALSLYKGKVKGDLDRLAAEVLGFLRERMQSFLRARAVRGKDSEVGEIWFREGNYRSDLVDAVLAHDFDNVARAYRRVVSLVIFHKRPEFDPLMVVYKRAARIVPKDFSVPVRPELFSEEAERRLWEAALKAQAQSGRLMEDHRYEEFLELLASLREPIDLFFSKVFVMDEDRAVRDNRLAVLKVVCDLFDHFADFSQIVVENKA